MTHGLGLPRPRICLQLYFAIALALAVLLGLAGANIKFAAETIRTAHRVQGKGLQALVRVGRAEVLLSDLRRLVDAASLAPTRQSVAAAAYQVNSGELAELLRTLEPAPADALSRRFEVATAQASAVFAHALSSGVNGPSPLPAMPPPATTLSAASAGCGRLCSARRMLVLTSLRPGRAS
jgi:hypothetical protein